MNKCNVGHIQQRQIVKEVVNGSYQERSELKEVDGLFYADDSETPFKGETTTQLDVGGGRWEDWVRETYDEGLKVKSEVTNPLNPVIGQMQYLDGKPWHGKEFALSYEGVDEEYIYRAGILVLSRHIKFDEIIEETIEVDGRRYQKGKDGGQSWCQSLNPNQEITTDEYEAAFESLTKTYGTLTGIK